MASPSSQKDRAIGFFLKDDHQGDTISVPLVIRPEDLTRVDPSRIAAVQTLGGAWVDNFGPGMATINISGHTGWRGAPTADGVQSFLDLKSGVYDSWHARRARAAEDGADPNSVKLIFSDALDRDVSVVAPMTMVLKRNKNRPLLMMYQISMTVIGSDVDPPSAATADQDAATSIRDRRALGTLSLSDSIDQLSGMADQLGDFPPDLADQIGGFLDTAGQVFNTALDAVNTVGQVIDDATSQVLSIAADVALCGRNAMWMVTSTIGDVISDAVPQLYMLGQIASTLEGVYCTITNSFGLFLTYLDYSDLYGAFMCSSTAGGSPLSPLRGQNAFSALSAAIDLPVSITQAAQSAMGQLRGFDPALRPVPYDQVGDTLETMSDGIDVG